MEFEYLLVKIGEVKYQTPCGKYTIEYSNMAYMDEVVWVAKGKLLFSLYGETLSDLLEKIIDRNPYMKTELYQILHGADNENTD